MIEAIVVGEGEFYEKWEFSTYTALHAFQSGVSMVGGTSWGVYTYANLDEKEISDGIKALIREHLKPPVDNEVSLQINYDTDALEIMEGVNVLLNPHGLEFKDDEKEHDGFIIYSLRPTE